MSKQARKDPATLPGNVHKNMKITELRNMYPCKKNDAACPGTHCYDTTDGDHLILGHAHFDCWAAAIVCPIRFAIEYAHLYDMAVQLKDDGSATDEKPPNHTLFDPTSTRVSPVLQRRQAALAAQNSNQPTAPVFNLNVGAEVLSFFRPSSSHSSAPSNQSNSLLSTLLLPSREIGPDMALNLFCANYDLSASILDKLTANDYTHARFLRYITIKDLEEMDFKKGQIAALRDAVEAWSAPSQ